MFHIPPYPAMHDPNLTATEPMTPEQIDAIRALGDEILRQSGAPGGVGFHESSRTVPAIRHCLGGWFPFPSEDKRTQGIYEMAADVAQQANALHWQFDIWGFYDKLHYVRYDAVSAADAQPGHFAWHQDKGDDWRRPQRKLAVVTLLSDPSEYEGGEFQIFDGRPLTLEPKAKGTMLIFPSWLQHRVLPVTRGERRSLVGWLCGRKFT